MLWILVWKTKQNVHLGSILNSLHSVIDASGSQYSVCVISQCFLSHQLLFPVCLCSSFSLHLFPCTFPQTAVSMETKSERPAWVWWSAVRQRGGGRIVCVCVWPRGILRIVLYRNSKTPEEAVLHHAGSPLAPPSRSHPPKVGFSFIQGSQNLRIFQKNTWTHLANLLNVSPQLLSD